MVVKIAALIATRVDLARLAPLSLVAPVVAIALDQGVLVGGQHAVHLLAAEDGVFEILLHLIDVLLEALQKGEHFFGLLVKVADLLILSYDSLICDVSNEGEILLDTVEVVFWRESRKQRHFTLEIRLGRPHKDVELLGLDQVGAACNLANEHIEKEAALLDELDLAGSKSLLWRQGWHVQTGPAVDETVSKHMEVAVSAEYLEPAQSIEAEDRVLIVIKALWLVRIANREGLGAIHTCKASLDLELSVHFLVVVHVVLADEQT